MMQSEPGNLLVKRFKDAVKNNPFEFKLNVDEFLLSEPVNMAKHTEVKVVLDYLLNMFGHTILSQSPYQIPRFDQAFRLGNM